jgi:two-component system, LytTR family, sensor kinase
MIPYFNNKWYYRLISGSLAGIITWLIAEVIFNIRYRYFDLFQKPENYLVAAILGVLLFETIYRISVLLDKKNGWQMNPGKRLALQILYSIAAAFFWIFVVRLSAMFIFYSGKLIILSDELTILAPVTVLILMQNLAEFGFFLNERYRLSLAEVEKFRKENAEYQFEMLKLQLNPHFLFNSLNTLSSLVHEDTSKASDFIRRLSDVYRYVLDNRNKELVTLKVEMDFIQAFSFLQGIRFQGMIDFRFEISEESLNRKIAPMTLQLLVENAVKHNIASGKNPLVITILSDKDSLVVLNNLQPKAGQPGTGVGLKNITSRYAFLTERKVEIVNENNVFKVVIPLI